MAVRNQQRTPSSTDGEGRYPNDGAILCLAQRHNQSRFSVLLMYPGIYCWIGGIYAPDLCTCQQLEDDITIANPFNKKPTTDPIKLHTQAIKERSVIDPRTGIPDPLQDVAPSRNKHRTHVFYKEGGKDRLELGHTNMKWSQITQMLTCCDSDSRQRKELIDLDGFNTGSFTQDKCDCAHIPRKLTLFLKRIYFFCALVVHLSSVVRDIVNPFRTYIADTDFVSSLSTATFQGYFSVLFLTSSLTFYRRYLPTVRTWLDYEESYGIHFDLSKKLRWIKIAFWMILAFISSQTVGVVIGIVFYYETMNELWPFDRNRTTERYMSAAYIAIFTIVSVSAYFGANTFRATLVVTLIHEYQVMHDKLLTILTDKSSPDSAVEAKFEDFLKQLKSLDDLVDKSYHLTKHTVAAAYIFCIPLFCFVMYGIVSGALKWDQIWILASAVLLSIVALMSTTLGCGQLHSQMRSVRQAPYSVSWKHLSPSILRKLSVFMSHLGVQDVGFSVYGMFTITMQTLLMIGGTILTYCIIVVQFQVDTNPSKCPLVNTTF